MIRTNAIIPNGNFRKRKIRLRHVYESCSNALICFKIVFSFFGFLYFVFVFSKVIVDSLSKCPKFLEIRSVKISNGNPIRVIINPNPTDNRVINRTK